MKADAQKCRYFLAGSPYENKLQLGKDLEEAMTSVKKLKLKTEKVKNSIQTQE